MQHHWQHILKNFWGISAELIQLDGEYDLNFLATDQNGDGYILKVMRPSCDIGYVDMQTEAIAHLCTKDHNVPLPNFIPSSSGRIVVEVEDENGVRRLCWAQQKLPGILYANTHPKSFELIQNIGENLGRMHLGFAGFEHTLLDRKFKWNLLQSLWIENDLQIISDKSRRNLLAGIAAAFKAILPALRDLPQQALHNDLNDHNILISFGIDAKPFVSGILDFGDMCIGPRICDVAITAAYIALDHPTPEIAINHFLTGYIKHASLTAQEVELLLPLIEMRLAVSVVNSTLMAGKNPDDPYVVISQKAAWDFLEHSHIDATSFGYRMKVACGLPVTSHAKEVEEFLLDGCGTFAPIVGQDLSDWEIRPLSVEKSTIPQDPFNLTKAEAFLMGSDDTGSNALGYYGEPRLIYTEAAFKAAPQSNGNRRTVHLGVDIFCAAGTSVASPLGAVVHQVKNCGDYLDYGGLVILRHELPSGENFFTFYGHLKPEVCHRLKEGQPIQKGQAFAKLGSAMNNRGWDPHLHFQLFVTAEGIADHWPGVADPAELELWQALCPNPAALLNLPSEKTAYQPVDVERVLELRKERFSQNLKLFYPKPVIFSRGWKHYLFDHNGQPFLDAYNNVPHVGHAHPRIQKVASDQLKRLNTNTRYLHEAQTDFAAKILAKMPSHLTKCFFVNSGSEANELALRLARAHTGGKDMVTLDHGYHGNTTGAIDVSAYKFNALGGVGQPDWVHLLDLPDDYNGTFKGDRMADKYAAQLPPLLNDIHTNGKKLAGFIAETFPSVGGQIIPPDGYLANIYSQIKNAGGVCIADEVQTGLGRLGAHYFAFEHQKISPDIVVLGKPIGNGHPIGVVVTTDEIAASFSKGPEFFSTFGGSTLSCLIGSEVLSIVEDEGLQANALEVGGIILSGLKELAGRHYVIGDVRGMGLFIGVELVENRDTRTPATKLAGYVVNHLLENRILIGTEGPFNNILKIRPPLTITSDDAELIISTLDDCLKHSWIELEYGA